jgi:hypothetical protein
MKAIASNPSVDDILPSAFIIIAKDEHWSCKGFFIEKIFD